ncbi:hypothetical protein [Bradyrhizobium sp. CCBAU 53338]|uniref:hypothetical protein n=1 Tax=Bradyrhizobium sp. CCBAU 53338 TaxID=1325111 RepID=UPI00188B6A2C|nr:hypothetical protein [Bradyrhizobium sp. CCBAU 53338]
MKTALDRCMAVPARQRDRASPVQPQQTALTCDHCGPINHNWQPSTAAPMQHTGALGCDLMWQDSVWNCASLNTIKTVLVDGAQHVIASENGP